MCWRQWRAIRRPRAFCWPRCGLRPQTARPRRRRRARPRRLRTPAGQARNRVTLTGLVSTARCRARTAAPGARRWAAAPSSSERPGSATREHAPDGSLRPAAARPEEGSARHAFRPGQRRGGRRGWRDERGSGDPGRGSGGYDDEAEGDTYSAERREAARLTRRWRSAAKRAAAAFAGACVGAPRCSVQAKQVMQGYSSEDDISSTHAPALQQFQAGR